MALISSMKEFSQTYLAETREEIIKNLSELISFQSIRDESDPQYKFGKEIDKALQFVLTLAQKKGCRTKYKDGYYGYCEIGQGEKLVTILVHLDVVPAEGKWNSHPFELLQRNGKLIGRGVLDDKGPAIACIYALDMLQQSYKRQQKEFHGRIRLVFGVDEESAWEDMKQYVQNEELPTCGFTADSDFPVVYAEKGILSLEVSIVNREKIITDIQAGVVANMVPGKCTVKLAGGDQKVYEGKAVHACESPKGDNAIKNCILDLHKNEIESPLVNFWISYIGNEPNGKKLGCDIRDEISGELTMNVGTIHMNSDWIRMGIDIRFPVTCDALIVEKMICERLKDSGAILRKVAVNPPLYIPADSSMVKTLTDCFYNDTGIKADPVVTGGGTYARALPNIVAFGPVFPGRECTEHQPNEYILENDFFKMIEIYYAALAQLIK